VSRENLPFCFSPSSHRGLLGAGFALLGPSVSWRKPLRRMLAIADWKPMRGITRRSGSMIIALLLLREVNLEGSYHGFIVPPFRGAVLGAEKGVGAPLRDRPLALKTVGGAEALLDGILWCSHADSFFLLPAGLGGAHCIVDQADNQSRQQNRETDSYDAVAR
jgi:hypothetical protein